MMHLDVIIIGAGAAGLMCCIETSKRGRSTLIIEHNNTVGKKIRISGGGRCNFTNINVTPKNFLSKNPHYCTSALTRYTSQDFISKVEKHSIPYHEKKLGQLFCDHSSKDIITMLVREAEEHGAIIHVDERVQSVIKNVENGAENSRFTVTTQHQTYTCNSVVVATGGLSIPSLGANDFGYRLAKKFGHTIVETRPALVPLTFSDKVYSPFKELSGLSADTLLTANNATFRENTLFTHRGLSGPAVLQISSYWDHTSPLTINLDPDSHIASLLQQEYRSNAELTTVISSILPKRLVQTLLHHFRFTSKPMKQYTPKELASITQSFLTWNILPNGDEGYAKAEVTIGGVNTYELSSKTMESKLQPGLYFIGEVADVTGWLGGYNFQWAWSSGYAAGQYA